MSEFLPPGAPEPRQRLPLWLLYAGLAILGVELAVWGAFLVPMRLPGGIEGLSVVIAVVGNIGVGVLAAIGTHRVQAAAVSGIAWLAALLVISTLQLPADEVIIPGRLPSDPGVAVVGYLFFFAGTGASVVAILVANVLVRRFTASATAPTNPG